MIEANICQMASFCYILDSNKTRQGYVRKHILKPAGYLFAGQDLAGLLSW